MKRIFCIIITVLLFLCVAGGTLATESKSAKIHLSVLNVPESFDRSIAVTIGRTPSDSVADVTLSGLNQYTADVHLPAGEYFIGARVAYDVSGDFPIAIEPGSLTVESAQSYEVSLSVSSVSFYEQMTGTPRYQEKIAFLETPEGFDTSAPAQIGAYFSAPKGFDKTIIVYLTNLYTGTSYELKVYSSNLLAAVMSNCESGLYCLSGARVAGDDSSRYTFTCEPESMSTNEGVNFHLTVTDTKTPAREITTPSHDENEIVQEAHSKSTSASNEAALETSGFPSDTEQRTGFSEKGILIAALCFLLVSILVCALLLRHARRRRN